MLLVSSTPPSRPLTAALLVAATALAGCAAPAAVAHDLPELPLLDGPRGSLRTDLPADEAAEALARLESLEAALDTAYPFLPPPGEAGRPRLLVLRDPARFALAAQEHAVDPAQGAFLCSAGEVVVADRGEAAASGPPYPLEPPIRPLAAALLRRRLLAAHPALPLTWLEEGLAAVFVEIVAAGDEAQEATRTRERLLDAYLPVFLGAPPLLRRLVLAAGDAERRRAGSSASAWAVTRFLLATPERSELLDAALRLHAGQPRPGDPGLEALSAALDALEPELEAWLQAETLRALLAAIRDAPHQVDRWEAAAALRLLANVDLDADASAEVRARQVAATPELLAEHPPPVRFLDGFAEPIAAARAARSRLRAMANVHKAVQSELERRRQGYGHPALERGRATLTEALKAEMLR